MQNAEKFPKNSHIYKNFPGCTAPTHKNCFARRLKVIFFFTLACYFFLVSTSTSRVFPFQNLTYLLQNHLIIFVKHFLGAPFPSPQEKDVPLGTNSFAMFTLVLTSYVTMSIPGLFHVLIIGNASNTDMYATNFIGGVPCCPLIPIPARSFATVFHLLAYTM